MKTKFRKAEEAMKFAENMGWSEVAKVFDQAANAYVTRDYRNGNRLFRLAQEMETPLLADALKK